MRGTEAGKKLGGAPYHGRLLLVLASVAATVAFAALSLWGAGLARAEPVTYQGVTFPSGNSSFADGVEAFDPGAFVDSQGRVIPQDQRNDDPNDALGPPQSNILDSASLGDGGSITVRFTDNVLTGSGTPAADLYIFETGARTEPFAVEVSRDCQTFVSVGTVGVTSQTSAIDIDRFGFGPNDLLRCVRITDVVDGTRDGAVNGADIDAVGAISSRSANDLSITKTDDPDPATAGADLTYTLRATNRGFTTLDGVTVSDELPAGVEFVSARFENGQNTGECQTAPQPGSTTGQDTNNVVRCDVGTLGVNETATVTVTVRPTQEGRLTNTARVSSPAEDADPADNTATEETTVNPGADLSIAKDGPASATLGRAFDYRLTARNAGPSTAQSVVVTDDLPDGVTYNDGASTPGCEPIDGTADPNDVRCTLGDLASGESRDVIINVTPNRSGDLQNTAAVDSSTPDPDTADNTDSASTRVSAADLSVQKQGPATATDEDEFDYVLVITNDGPSAAANVTLRDTLPEGVEFVRAGTDQRCGAPDADGVVACDLGDIASGERQAITIRVRAQAVGEQVNRASVGSDTDDPDPEDNRDEATTVGAAPPSADLSVDKVAPQTARQGRRITYTLRVTNDGPDAALGVRLTDALPGKVRFVSASETCRYDRPAREVDCELGVVASGGARTVRIVVEAGQTGLAVNTARVSGETGDPDRENNRDRATTRITSPCANLRTTVKAPATIKEGRNFAYDVTVTNRGPDTAEDVTLRSVLPRGVSFVRASEGCRYDRSTRTVSCNLGDIAEDSRKKRSIVVKAERAGDVRLRSCAARSETPPCGAVSADRTGDRTATRSEPQSGSAPVVEPSELPETTVTDPDAGEPEPGEPGGGTR